MKLLVKTVPIRWQGAFMNGSNLIDLSVISELCWRDQTCLHNTWLEKRYVKYIWIIHIYCNLHRPKCDLRDIMFYKVVHIPLVVNLCGQLGIFLVFSCTKSWLMLESYLLQCLISKYVTLDHPFMVNSIN